MASPYFGNTLTDLQRGRTAAEEIAGRIAIQKLIQETAAQEAAARRQEQGRNYDLQRQQLAQQGAYQQGMLGNQMRSIDADAINRQARALFDQSAVAKDDAYRNAMLEQEKNKLAAMMFTPRATESAADIKAQADAAEFGKEQNLRALAEQNLANLMGQQATAEAGLARIGTQAMPGLQREYEELRAGPLNHRLWNPLAFRSTGERLASEKLFNQLPQGFGADPNETIGQNIERAKRLFNTQTSTLSPLIKSTQDSGVGTFVMPLGNGMFTNTLPMTATSTNAMPRIANSPLTTTSTNDARRAFILEQARRTKLLPGVDPAAVDAEVRRLLGD